MKVHIVISGFRDYLEIKANTEKGTVSFNNKTVNYDANTLVSKLENLIAGWEKEYFSHMLDAESFVVRILKDSEMKTYIGNGKYPDNYNQFRDFLEEVGNAGFTT